MHSVTDPLCDFWSDQDMLVPLAQLDRESGHFCIIDQNYLKDLPGHTKKNPENLRETRKDNCRKD